MAVAFEEMCTWAGSGPVSLVLTAPYEAAESENNWLSLISNRLCGRENAFLLKTEQIPIV